jgi:hypothetical protein
LKIEWSLKTVRTLLAHIWKVLNYYNTLSKGLNLENGDSKNIIIWLHGSEISLPADSYLLYTLWSWILDNLFIRIAPETSWFQSLFSSFNCKPLNPEVMLFGGYMWKEVCLPWSCNTCTSLIKINSLPMTTWLLPVESLDLSGLTSFINQKT